MASKDISITLARAEAIVLFEFLAKMEKTGESEILPSEQRVLWGIESILESSLAEPLQENYAEILEQARAIVVADN